MEFRSTPIRGTEPVAVSKITDPFVLPRGERLANRLCKAAIAEGLATPRNDPSPSLLQLYSRWAQSGAGLLISGNVHVDRRYLERPSSLVLDRDSNLDAFAAFARVARGGGAGFWLQLNHAGRQCPRRIAAKPLGPSANPGPFFLGGYDRSRATREDEIESTIEAFAFAAHKAKAVGCTGVQIHAAHGYLLSSFLSPRLNRRTDQWGGPLVSRARFACRVVSAARRAVGADFTIAVKLNATDFERNGFGGEDVAATARLLAAAGCDLIELSGGTYERLFLAGEHPGPRLAAQWDAQEAYFLDSAIRIGRVDGVKLMVTGGWRTHAAMAAALASGSIDLIGLARPFCVDPGIAARLLSGACVDLGTLPRAPFLGRGFFGPASMWRGGRRLNAIAQQAWYALQVERLAQGGEVDPSAQALPAFIHLMRRDITEARTRARSDLRGEPSLDRDSHAPDVQMHSAPKHVA